MKPFTFLICTFFFIYSDVSALDLEITSSKNPPYKLEVRENGLTPRIILLPITEKRLGISTLITSGDSHPSAALQISTSSVLYDEQGKNWIYVRDKSGSYYRSQIVIKGVQGDAALVTFVIRGEVGRKIVQHGASVLYGIETGVGK